MREGGLGEPTRHPLDWTNPDFTDAAKLDEEMRRQFDVCHGCRRCFNLCDSFPRLFDLIDESASGELNTVKSDGFPHVVEACTLCDMCFMTKCPYVPPHELNIDFPHLMLRYRAMQNKKGEVSFPQKQLAQTDRNGALASAVAPLANWATSTGNTLTRPLMEKVADIHREAAIPKFNRGTLVRQAKKKPLSINPEAPAYGRKVILYATCFGNYNNPTIGLATRAVLAHNGVETEVVYPGCCGMPLLEQGDLAKVAASAKSVAQELRRWVDEGYDVIALIPSCALMLKNEWPLILPEDENVIALSKATYDIGQYVVSLSKKFGLVEGLQPLGEDLTIHMACHARAQNIGQKAVEMLRLIPETNIQVIERCSGHGGTWGLMKENFEVALAVGKPAARQALKNGHHQVLSECPLAGEHLLQGIERLIPAGEQLVRFSTAHPIEIFAKAYGLEVG